MLGACVTREFDEVEGSPGTGRDKADRRRASVWSRADRWALAELFALTGLAIAQPALDSKTPGE